MEKNITKIRKIELETINLRLKLLEKEEELKQTNLYKEINVLKNSIQNNEIEMKENEDKIINYFIANNLKEFKTLDGKKILLQKIGSGTLIGYDEKDIPETYFKTKEVKQLDKTRLKNDFINGLIELPNTELKISYKLKYKI